MSKKCDLVIVANRLPVRRVRGSKGSRWETSPGGLVSALLPIVRAAENGGGAWVGWTGVGRGTFGPFTHEGVRNIPVNLPRKLLAGYYEGMANSTLWPLYHDVIRPPSFQRPWWRDYREANAVFARAAAEHAAEGAVVWVHDYHLHLVPGMLREARPDLRIGFFLHIPLPGRGLFAQLPWRSDLIRGTLGADLVGFQTTYGAGNFIELARRYAGASVAHGGVRLNGRYTRVGAFPISIDSAMFDAMAKSPAVAMRAAELRRTLGGRKVMLGIDRMDYTKGIDVRLRAFGELLKEGLATPDQVVFIQSGVPTRERVEDYSELRSTVEELVGQINSEFGSVGKFVVQYLRQNLPVSELVALYMVADVMLVTPLRDGMNLVAKEYVASRTDGRGVLVLSEFAGASIELKQALTINPHDLDGVVAAMHRAINMGPEEQKRRMTAMRRIVFKRDVFAWAESFMEALAGKDHV